MKSTKLSAGSGGFIIFATACGASFAGDFINLGFEDPDLSHVRPIFPGATTGSGPAKEVLRGWNLSHDGIPFSDPVIVSQDGGYPVSLTAALNPRFVPLDFGTHAIFLGWIVPEHFVTYELSQTGFIPRDAIGINYLYDETNARVLVDGSPVPQRYDPGSLVGYADVSAYAGRTVELKFVFPGAFGLFDIAGFQRTPEPSTWILLGLGGGALLWKARRGRR